MQSHPQAPTWALPAPPQLGLFASLRPLPAKATLAHRASSSVLAYGLQRGQSVAWRKLPRGRQGSLGAGCGVGRDAGGWGLRGGNATCPFSKAREKATVRNFKISSSLSGFAAQAKGFVWSYSCTASQESSGLGEKKNNREEHSPDFKNITPSCSCTKKDLSGFSYSLWKMTIKP